VASAGVEPLGHIPPLTLLVLQERSISCEGLYSKGLDEVDLHRMDLIVNFTGFPILELVPESFRTRIVDSYVPDPYGRGLDSYRLARDVIEQIVLTRLPKWLSIQRI
jgi:protein-tyrosine-phosphatase